MKKTTRNILAMALAAQMTVSLAACGSKKKDDGSASAAGSGSGSTGAATAGDSTGGAKSTASGSGKIVKESDPYFLVNAAKLQAKINQEKEVRYSDQNAHYIAGDLVISEVIVDYKIPDDIQKELDSMNLNDDKQLEKYNKTFDDYFERSLQIFNMNGEFLSSLPLDDSTEFIGAYPGANDEILIVCSKMNIADCSAKPVLFVISKTGEKLRDINVTVDGDLVGLSIHALENGNYILSGYGCIYLVNAEGKQIAKVEDPNFTGIVLCSGGKWYAATMKITADGETAQIQEFDADQGKLVGKPVVTSNDVFYVNQGKQDCFVMDSNGVNKLDLANNTKSQVMAWKDTDINFMTIDINGGQILSENEMTFFQRSYIEDNGRDSMDRKASGAAEISVVKLTKTDKNPHAGKTILKLGMNGEISSDFVEKVLQYNQDESKAARIEITDYATDRSDLSFEWGGNPAIDSKNAAQLQLDMLSGEGPDIIVGFSGASQFNDPSMLLDLNTYLDNDSSINRENYYDNIFRAFETDGKLYTIPLTYSIEGLAANGKYDGVKEKWTYADFNQMAASLPSDKMPLSSDSYDRLLRAWMMHQSSLFVDYANKKVNFESDEFKQLLETIKKYGETQNKNSGAPEDPMFARNLRMNDDIGFLNDTIAACSVSLNDLEQYCMLLRHKDIKVIFTGIPSASGMGMTARGHLTMSIAAECKDPDAAWNFISSFLAEDVQQQLSFNSDMLPINKNAFKTNCKTSIEVNQAELKRLREEAKDLPPEKVGDLSNAVELTQEKADALEALISSVEHAQSSDTDVMDIILEEAAGFFAGQRSIDDVCKNIQNRASLVVQER